MHKNFHLTKAGEKQTSQEENSILKCKVYICDEENPRKKKKHEEQKLIKTNI